MTEQWLTAAIYPTSTTRRYLCRLAAFNIDHRVEPEHGSLRVYVLKRDLQVALELRPDQDSAATGRVKKTFISPATGLRTLVAIPAGALIGNLAAATLGPSDLNSTVAAALGAVLMPILIELFWHTPS